MKLIIAIVNHDDAHAVTGSLTRAGFSSTRLATTGGFLRAGNVTVLACVDEDRVKEAVEAIKSQVHSRSRTVPAGADTPYPYPHAADMEVTVGGATIFVVDVEHFERL